MIIEHPNDKRWNESELDHAWRTMPRAQPPGVATHTPPATTRHTPRTPVLDIVAGVWSVMAYSALLAFGIALLAAWFDLI